MIVINSKFYLLESKMLISETIEFQTVENQILRINFETEEN